MHPVYKSMADDIENSAAQVDLQTRARLLWERYTAEHRELLAEARANREAKEASNAV